MKLRLGLLNRDLAFRCNLSDTSVSRIINQWIPNIASCLKGLIIWPENDITYSNIPESFKPNYKKVVEIKLTAPDGVIDAKYLMVFLCL
jgi:hypothetical protein